MNVISRKALIDFATKCPEAKSRLDAWFHEVKKASWHNFGDIKKKYNSASWLESNIVIFNIKGNHYRLEVKVEFKYQKIFIKWFGTHKEYDKRNKER
jgi:mRNA interferase HigB